ncbi:MAG: lipid II flippase MurJ, partial [Myxococcota bacterium]
MKTSTPPSTPPRPLTERLGLATLLMVGSVLLSRVVGFVREMIIAAQQGATGNTDAYFAAFTLPDVLNYILAGGTLSITFIPLFSDYLSRDDEPGGWRLFSTIATITGGLVLIAVVCGELFTEQLVPMLTPGSYRQH